MNNAKLQPLIILRHLGFAGIGAAIGVGGGHLLLIASPNGQCPEDSELVEWGGRKLSALVDASRPGDKSTWPIGNDAIDPERFLETPANTAELAAYVERHGFAKEAMLAVALMSRDPEYLITAARRYPDDPHLPLLVLTGDVLPDERREWLERFKRSQPDNLLSPLFLGGDLLANGEVEAGLAELRLAASATGYDDFVAQGGLAISEGGAAVAADL